jgi:hypothetical protein
MTARAEIKRWTDPEETRTRPRRLLRSAAAVLWGFFAVVVLSLGTDQVLHVLEVYPPWGQPMRETGLNILALAYRIAYAVVGSYIAARFAPHAPMRHALALGVVGFVVSSAGDRRDLHGRPGSELVPGRARAHGLALRLAGRSPIPHNAGRTMSCG